MVATEEEKHMMNQLIKFSIKEARIEAEICVLINMKNDAVAALLEKSSKSDLVFCGLAREYDSIEKHIQTIDHISNGLKNVVFVQNNGMASEIPTIFKPSYE